MHSWAETVYCLLGAGFLEVLPEAHSEIAKKNHENHGIEFYIPSSLKLEAQMFEKTVLPWKQFRQEMSLQHMSKSPQPL